MGDGWDDLVRVARSYALRKYGVPAVAITIHLLGQQHSHYEPMPLGALPATPKRTVGRWDSGSEPKQRDEFRAVYWPGRGTFFFPGSKQRAAVGMLWDAWHAGRPDVQQAELLRAADSDGTRLVDLFREHPAWNQLIVRGRTPGSYRLAGLPEGEEGAPVAVEGEEAAGE